MAESADRKLYLVRVDNEDVAVFATSYRKAVEATIFYLNAEGAADEPQWTINEDDIEQVVCWATSHTIIDLADEPEAIALSRKRKP